MKKEKLLVCALLAAVCTLTGCTRTESGTTPPAGMETEASSPAESPVDLPAGSAGSTGSTVGDWEEVTLRIPWEGEEISLPAAEVDLSYFDGCPLVRADESPEEMVWNVSRFRGLLEKEYGMKVGISSDWLAPGEEVPAASREILMGATNRPESAAAAGLRESDYLIRWENDRLLIAGGSLEAEEAAEDAFLSLFVDLAEGKLYLPLGDGYRFEQRYPCGSLTLCGTELSEYAAEKGLGKLEAAVLSLTGSPMGGASGKSISLRTDPADEELICAAEQSADGGIALTAGPNATADEAAAAFVAWMKQKAGFDPQKTHQTLSLDASDLPVRLTEEDIAALCEPTFLYVSPLGDDAAAGTEDQPLRTPEGARLRVRELLRSSPGGITVYFGAGDYSLLDGGIRFDAEDSGIPGAPVVYSAVPGETVRFIGGHRIGADDIQPAGDAEILARVNDAAAREALYRIDLSAYLDAIPELYCYGHTAEDGRMPVEIYVGETALTTARWPDAAEKDAYVYTADKDVVTTAAGSKTIFYGDQIADRVSTWSDASVKKLRMFGYLFAEWTNELYDASLLDRDARSITLRGGLDGYFNSIGAHKRVYFCDLPEEITVPGECWIDRENRAAYFYPPEGGDLGDVYVSSLTEDMIALNGTRYVDFTGIGFVYTRGNAVRGTNAAHITLSDCTAAHTSAKGFVFTGADSIRVLSCEVYDTANGGVNIEGGDRRTLSPSRCLVENCDIHAVNRDQSTYAPGISAYGLGMVIRHNRLYDGTHEMIHVGSNDVIIEYNELFRCVRESSDMGAIYFGRNPTLMGTVIRYNYFHDMGNDYGGIGQFSVYLDDGNMGAEIYGNLFVRAAGTESGGDASKAAIMHHGVQFSHIYNNIFVDTSVAFRFVDWRGTHGIQQEGWFLWLFDRNTDRLHESVQKMREVDFDSQLWRTHYAGTIWENLYTYASADKITQMQNMSDKDIRKEAAKTAPRDSNEVNGNLFVSIPHVTAGGSCNFHDNLTADLSIFRDPANNDWELTAEGLALAEAECPGFEAPPFPSMGRVD
ncbi:MAG: right-handed parallel beta-helix repeat-containing protein [Clostridia bacterium]|nr:right-handed parallel beta-helix repeat-containing protein [Clostridia bacterium]